jgi:hypothetical protein
VAPENAVRCDSWETWYQEEEIESFKERARFVSKILRQSKNASGTEGLVQSLNLLSLFGEDCFERGLEQRVYLVRCVNRVRAMRSLVQFQHKCGGNSLSLSFHSRRCTQAARSEAYNTGLIDARIARSGYMERGVLPVEIRLDIAPPCKTPSFEREFCAKRGTSSVAFGAFRPVNDSDFRVSDSRSSLKKSKVR